METLKKEFLIGGSKDYHNIYTMEVEVTTRNNYPEFTASFCEGELFNIDDANEYAEDYYDEVFECMDAETKLNYLQNGDITKKEWIEDCIRYEYDYRERIDCSCTDYELYIDGELYNFETVGCGQHDPRDDDHFIPVNNTVKKLIEFWDVHHLKEINEDDYKELLKLLKNMEHYEDIETELLKKLNKEDQ